MLKRQTILFFLLTFLVGFTFAQTGDIRGFVFEKSTGEPAIFINVYLKGTQLGSATDVNGYYNISKVPAGTYTLTCTAMGFDSVSIPITLKPGEIITKKIFLEKSAIQLKTVDISAEKQEQRTEVKMSVTKVTPKEIKQIPSVGGEPDLAQYLQVLPGVVFTGDQGGQLYIRGGSPVQNKVLMDGMIIYNPFHSIGFFSVFDTDILRNVDVYTGGFSANYGGRISSIMDITTRDGNKKRFSGKVSANTFNSKMILEGPLKKQKDENSGSSSFLISAKTSYIDRTSKKLYNYQFDENGTQPFNLKNDSTNRGLPFNYTDLYGKISFNAANGSKFSMFGFRFDDAVKYNASNIGWTNTGGGSNFVMIPQNSAVLIKGNLAYSQYGVKYKDQTSGERFSNINGFNMGIDFTYGLGKNELNYGIEVLGFSTQYKFTNAVGKVTEQTENTTEGAGYFKYRLNIGKLVLDPSIRAHYYAALNNFSPEPRIGIKFNATDKMRFKAAAGQYSQNLISANSDRDIVNLFYGFLSGPDNLQKEFTPEKGFTGQPGEVKEVKHKLQKAQHYIFGVEYDLLKHLDLNVEVYHKQFSQLTNVNRDKLFDDTPYNVDKPDNLKKDFIIESGYARGFDVLLKYDYKRFYFWLAYSRTYVKRWDGKQEYFPVFDRRHNVNLVSSYTFGKNLYWQLDARWNLGSGFPFLPTQGFYESLPLSDGINSSYTSSNGSLGIQYAPLTEQKRLPYYHRFDVTIKKHWELSETSSLDAVFSVTNMYNRQNIFYLDRIRYKKVYQLPILPSIGLSLNF